MIGSNLIETPQDILARSQTRTSSSYSADDRKNQDSFDDFLSSAERPGTADEQAPVSRKNRKDKSADSTENPTDQAGGPAAEMSGKPSPESPKGEVEVPENDQAAAIGAVLLGSPGAPKVGQSASAETQSTQLAQAGLLSGNPKGAGSQMAAAAAAEGDQSGVELPQLSPQAAKPKAKPDHAAASGQASTEKTRQPDAAAALKAAAAEGQTAQSTPSSQYAATSLWGAESSLRQQKTIRSEPAEVGLVGRLSGEGQVGDHARIAGRETAQPAQQVAVHIIRAVQSKQSVLRINLHPKELGQVDVTMEMQDGRLKVTILAERPDALQQLQQGSRTLERALQEAGLDISHSDFHFASRDGQSGSADRQTGSQDRFSVAGLAAGDDHEAGTRTTARYIEGVLDISL
ncbi:flagellar hook-length control protein FliK [Rhodospirillaceae bacterium SYSU D60014]|uniref:flagellar hook-length control protein FliK n=1 Tax=Virgifigura deserti TaxID=2268457 RepID=UPI000E670AF0